MTRTVRDVLRAFVDPEQIDNALAELRGALSTGDQWVSRELPAEQLTAGDVIADKRGRLWSVIATKASEFEVGKVDLAICRGPARKLPTFAPDHPVPVLVRRDDARALALLERELGAVAVGREIA